MTHIVLNGAEWSREFEPRTWGGVLGAVEHDLEANGEVVTAARFDGVDIPTYRDPEMLDRALEGLSSIEIDTAPPQVLLRRGLGEAAGALEALHGETARIGAAFRGSEVATANQELVALAQSLSTLVTLVGVVGQAMHLDFETFEVSGESAQGLFERTGAQIGTLVEYQRDEDWVAVADTLEHDVTAALARWRDLLNALYDRLGRTPGGET